jgi:hypothetical protein
MSIIIPGFLVVAALIYAVAASGFMVFNGRRFIAVSESKNQAEAEYRYVLTRVRENAESIALLRGDDEERKGHLFVLTAASISTVPRAWHGIGIQYRNSCRCDGSGRVLKASGEGDFDTAFAALLQHPYMQLFNLVT